MIHLVDIDPGNWRLKLEVAESQKHYVANSSVILARIIFVLPRMRILLR